jgi:2-aminoadipate transaminase
MTLLDNITLARRARRTLPSAIREILKVTERPEVISFAGGLPAPEVFPVEELRHAFDRLLSQHGAAAMQYGPTEGYGPLREQIAARLSRFGRPVSADEIVVTSGSQQALDLTGRVLVDAGDPVLVESPSYLAALQVFTSLEAKLFTVEADADGVIPGALEEALRRVKPKVLYLNPDFQNPSGARLTLERR